MWKELKNQLDMAYKKEEEYWSQKVRIQWLSEGDKNTHFFHASVAQRRAGNRMESGGQCVNEEELVGDVSNFYSKLVTTEDGGIWEELLDGIPSTINASMNSRLIRPVEEGEIKKALFSMSPNKSPGMDGMTPIF